MANENVDSSDTMGAATPSEASARSPQLVVLGGYGLLGRVLVRRVLAHTQARVRVVGRREAPAQALVAELAQEFGADRIDARRADAARADEVAQACHGADWLLIALDSDAHLETVMEGALAAKVSIIDLLIHPRRSQTWSAWEARFQKAGLSVVTEAGVSPGLPGVVLRAICKDRPAILSVDVAISIRPKITPRQPMPASLVDLLSTFTAGPTRYAFGHSVPDFRSLLFPNRFFWFRPPFRQQTVSVMGLPEVAAVAREYPKVRKIRYLVGGFNLATMYVGLPLLFPFILLFGRWLNPLLARVLYYGFLRPFSRPPFGVALRAEAKGHVDARASMELQHDDEYGLTADVAVALLRAVSRCPPEPGVHLMAYAVDPDEFLEELSTLGARLHRTPEREPASRASVGVGAGATASS